MRTSIFLLAVVVSSFGCTPPSSPDAGPGGGGFAMLGGGTASTGGGSGGGGGGGEDAGTAPTPMTECTNAPPSDTGSSCAAGSNQPLCVMQSNTSCSDVCIWDNAAPSTPRGYCSTACTPGGDECPGGYECAAQDCSGGPTHVCVRRVVAGCTAVPVFGNSGRVLLSVGLRSANAYAVAYLDANVVTVRLMDGTTVVRELGTFPFGGFADELLAVTDDHLWWHVSPLIVRIDANGIETFTVPTDVSPLQLASAAGEVLAGTYRSRFGAALLRPDSGVLVEEAAALPVMYYARRLGDGTSVGQCSDGGVNAACATRDLVTAQHLLYPPDASFLTVNAGFAGASIDDFTMVSKTGDVFRRVGGQWVADVFADGATNGGAVSVGDDVYVSRQVDGGFQQFVKTETCWKRVNALNGVVSTALPGAKYGYYSTRSWCAQLQPK